MANSLPDDLDFSLPDDLDFGTHKVPVYGEGQVPPEHGEPSAGDGTFSGLESFGRGARQGSTLGFGDEMGGGVQAFLAKMANMAPEGSMEWAGISNDFDHDVKGVYKHARNAERHGDEAAKKDHSNWYLGGELAGAMAIPVPGGPVAGFSKAAIAKTMAQGALMGAGYGLGSSNADLLKGNLRGAAKDTALGGVLGAGGGALGKGVEALGTNLVGPLFKKAGGGVKNWLEETAAERALKAAGYINKDIKPLARRDLGLLHERGRDLLDLGVIRPGRKVDDVASRLSEKYGEVADSMEQLLSKADSSGHSFDLRPTLSRAKAEILDPLTVNGAIDPAVTSEASEISKLLGEYADLAAPNSGGIKFKDANAIKSRLQGQLHWGNPFSDASPNKEKYLKQLQHILLDEVDSQIDGAAGKPVGDAFRQAKQKYGAIVEALDKAKQGVAREVGNNAVSSFDYLFNTLGGAGGISSGSPYPLLATAGLTAAKNLAKDRGSSLTAVAANKLSKFAPVDAIESLIKSTPEVFGRFAPMLQKELAIYGRDGLTAMEMTLDEKFPEWKEVKEKIFGSETPGVARR